VGRRGLDSSGSGQGPVADCCERGNEPLGSIKDGEFLDWLSDCLLLKKDSAPWSWLVGWFFIALLYLLHKLLVLSILCR
jgi:hypothetical protein